MSALFSISQSVAYFGFAWNYNSKSISLSFYESNSSSEKNKIPFIKIPKCNEEFVRLKFWTSCFGLYSSRKNIETSNFGRTSRILFSCLMESNIGSWSQSCIFEITSERWFQTCISETMIQYFSPSKKKIRYKVWVVNLYLYNYIIFLRFSDRNVPPIQSKILA